jgi:AmmeMemoRadiSam system protein B/AmmeMemoRadiSam system protein A
MKNSIRIIPVIFFSIILFTTCNSQNYKDQDAQIKELKNRLPAVAGRFYPDDKTELEEELKSLFDQAKNPYVKDVLAIISPHAGYVFSGKVAASAFNQLDFEKKYDNIFLIGSSHTMYFEGASIYSVGNYITPLGEIKVNLQLAEKLITENQNINFVPEAHKSEHSLEVQLPFLQYKLKQPFQIVPIILGTQSEKVCWELASLLKPYFNEKNLFVISSDFSHYPSYDDANKWDDETAQAIKSNSAEEFLNNIEDKHNDDIPNMATRCCGHTSIYTLLNMTQGASDVKYNHILYENSGDTQYGDKNRVVGYHAFAISKTSKSSKFELTLNDKNELLAIARKTLEKYISSNELPEFNTADLSENIRSECGAFVSLYKNHELIGCIGRFVANEPLWNIVQQMVVASATMDSRFSRVTLNELKDIKIEISVLTPLKKIESIEEIELGKHGIYIVKGNRTGTFLPQVAIETGWSSEAFLGHCARDKAGIGWDGWKDAEIFTYEAIVFSE